MLLFRTDPTALALRKALDGDAARQQAVAGNLANLDTPGYQPRRVEFQNQLRAALSEQEAGSGEEDLERLQPQVTIQGGAALRRDGNSVDVETEMVELSESGLHYQAVVRLLSRKLQMLRAVVTEGGR
jgi:flagellar basal-body rod protein FlgB